MFVAKDLSNNNKVAIKKIMHSTEQEIKQNCTELFFLAKLQHLNIVKLENAFVIPETRQMWIVMEYLVGITLTQATKMEKFDEHQIAYISRELLYALKFIHKLQICHHDVKGSNVKQL